MCNGECKCLVRWAGHPAEAFEVLFDNRLYRLKHTRIIQPLSFHQFVEERLHMAQRKKKTIN